MTNWLKSAKEKAEIENYNAPLENNQIGEYKGNISSADYIIDNLKKGEGSSKLIEYLKKSSEKYAQWFAQIGEQLSIQGEEIKKTDDALIALYFDYKGLMEIIKCMIQSQEEIRKQTINLSDFCDNLTKWSNQSSAENMENKVITMKKIEEVHEKVIEIQGNNQKNFENSNLWKKNFIKENGEEMQKILNKEC